MIRQQEHATYQQFYAKYWRRRRFKAFEVSRNLKCLEFKKLIRRFVPPGTEVLDVGCGRGEFAESIANSYKTSAFDFSEQTVVDNINRNSGVRFFCHDALDEPLPNEVGRYGAVTCMDVIEHIPFDFQRTFLENVCRYLKIGGVLIISSPDRSQALRFKRNPEQPDDMFLKEYEGQPCADLLTEDQFDALLKNYLNVVSKTSVCPTMPYRPIDLLWKGIASLFAYRFVNAVASNLQIPCRYLIRVAVREQ